MQLVLMTVPFPPVFAVVHPPVKQTEPYEAQQCSLLFNPLSPNSVKRQFSPNDIHTMSRD